MGEATGPEREQSAPPGIATVNEANALMESPTSSPEQWLEITTTRPNHLYTVRDTLTHLKDLLATYVDQGVIHAFALPARPAAPLEAIFLKTVGGEDGGELIRRLEEFKPTPFRGFRVQLAPEVTRGDLTVMDLNEFAVYWERSADPSFAFAVQAPEIPAPTRTRSPPISTAISLQSRLQSPRPYHPAASTPRLGKRTPLDMELRNRQRALKRIEKGLERELGLLPASKEQVKALLRHLETRRREWAHNIERYGGRGGQMWGGLWPRLMDLVHRAGGAL
jgi:hypothetical protein